LIEIQVRMLPADEADPAAGRAFIGRELLAELLAEAGFPPLPSSVLPSPADPDFALGQCGRFYGSADPGCPALVEILDSGSELADRAE
jgi:hypothetical protein